MQRATGMLSEGKMTSAERSALISPAAALPSDNHKWAAALALGACALLLLLLVTACPGSDEQQQQEAMRQLRREVQALQWTTDALAAPGLHPSAQLRPVRGLPGATVLVLEPQQVATALPEVPQGAALVEAGPAADAVGAELLWLEGPAIAPSGTVLFTDTIAGQLLSWETATGVQVVAASGAARQCATPEIFDGVGSCLQVLEPGANGLLVAPDRSELLFADHGLRRIATLPLPLRRGATASTLVAKFNGARFNSPNDLARSPTTGDVYFTDPPYGIRLGTAACAATICPPAGCTCGRELSETPAAWFEQRTQSGRRISGVYRLPAAALSSSSVVSREAQLERLIDDLDFPNGIAVSPDGLKLFIAESGPRSRIVWLPLSPGGGAAPGVRSATLISNADVIRTNVAVSSRLQLLQHADDDDTAAAAVAVTQWTLGAMDGMTCDSDGRLWATAAGGVIVLDPSTGEHLATVQVGARAGNVVLAEDGYLYVAADHRLLRVKTNAIPQDN